ncbi:hypothetical protein P8452_20602 [Trifolium repens]|nr:hypothetical protein P8452_20602 [Trifolium repens]
MCSPAFGHSASRLSLTQWSIRYAEYVNVYSSLTSDDGQGCPRSTYRRQYLTFPPTSNMIDRVNEQLHQNSKINATKPQLQTSIVSINVVTEKSKIPNKF